MKETAGTGTVGMSYVNAVGMSLSGPKQAFVKQEKKPKRKRNS
jgi:hypothetical protein